MAASLRVWERKINKKDVYNSEVYKLARLAAVSSFSCLSFLLT